MNDYIGLSKPILSICQQGRLDENIAADFKKAKKVLKELLSPECRISQEWLEDLLTFKNMN